MARLETIGRVGWHGEGGLGKSCGSGSAGLSDETRGGASRGSTWGDMSCGLNRGGMSGLAWPVEWAVWTRDGWVGRARLEPWGLGMACRVGGGSDCTVVWAGQCRAGLSAGVGGFELSGGGSSEGIVVWVGVKRPGLSCAGCGAGLACLGPSCHTPSGVASRVSAPVVALAELPTLQLAAGALVQVRGRASGHWASAGAVDGFEVECPDPSGTPNEHRRAM